VTLKSSPLSDAHRRLGARMVGFGGWEMPLSYPSGTLHEHMACREAAVAFDVSHLGTVRLKGNQSLDVLQSTLTNDLGKIGPGRAQYSHLLDEDGSVVDDVIVWWVDDERFDVMPNASNTDEVTAAIGGTDVTGERAVIAVQGPAARERLAAVAPEAAAVPRLGVSCFAWTGAECVVAGTGYTGEDGVECAVPGAMAPAFWDALMDAEVVPAGLGARDTLRLEAGYPLHGHELGRGITPLQAGLGWVVAWHKETFRGKRALETERASGIPRRLRGLVTDGRRPPRETSPVLCAGKQVGVVTSGNFSPVLGRGIGLALLSPDIDTGDRLTVEVRGSRLDAQVVPTPFVTGSLSAPSSSSTAKAERGVTP
jgi:glycine cleavage system T protein (aminomethyltransferase)